MDGVGVLKSRLLEARSAEDVLTGVEPRTMLRTFSISDINACRIRWETEEVFSLLLRLFLAR